MEGEYIHLTESSRYRIERGLLALGTLVYISSWLNLAITLDEKNLHFCLSFFFFT